MRSIVGTYPLISFFAIAFSFTYLVWLPAVAVGGLSKMPPALALLLQVLAPFGPVVAALIVVLAEGQRNLKGHAQRLRLWRTNPLWYVAAFVIPIATMLAAYGVLFTFGNAPANVFNQLTPLSFGVAFLLILFLGGGQEELGWRGFALPRLQKRFGDWGSSLILGSLWALWHLPLWFIPEAPQQGVPFAWYTLHMLAFSLLFTWLYNQTSGNVLACMVMHASANAFPALTVLSIAPTSFADFFPPLVAIEWLLAIYLGSRKNTVRAERGKLEV